MNGLPAPASRPGTPGYVAPEILRGEPVDARADQFSFGVLLYELVTGDHPFDGRDGSSTIARILEHDPPAVISARPDCPGALARILMTCLTKTPADRYATTEDLVAALDNAGADATSPAPRRAPATQGTPPPPAIGSARWWWQFHQVAVTAVYGLTLYPMWRAREWVPDGLGTADLHGGGGGRGHRRQSPAAPLVHVAGLPDSTGRAASAIGRYGRGLADSAFALLTLGTAAGIAPEYPRWAALLIALAISSVLSSRRHRTDDRARRVPFRLMGRPGRWQAVCYSAAGNCSGARSRSTSDIDVSVAVSVSRAVLLMMGPIIHRSIAGTDRLRLTDSHSTITPSSTCW